MKQIMLVGEIACGKTTLCQAINGAKIEYKKTQSIEVVNCTIDTPGEYLEHRSLLRGLMITAVDMDIVVFVQSAANCRFLFSPGQVTAFPVPVIGVITKIDIATDEDRQQAREMLQLAGVETIFEVSAKEGTGINELLRFLE